MRVLSALLGWLMLAAAVPASAQEPGTLLFVELVVNGRVHGELVEIEAAGAALLVPGAALAAAGISGVEAGRIDVTADTRFAARYEPLRQRLFLTVDPALLPLTRHGRTATAPIPAERGSGLVLNYDLNLQLGDGGASGGLWTEQRLFSPAGSLVNSGAARFGDGDFHYLRYDTRFLRVDEARALHIAVGDVISGGLDWTRAYRLGGMQVGRAWQVRPDLVTMPLPRFAGEAAVPTAVDLFIDGQRQPQRQVEPGRFVLEDMPVVTGAGQARIVTTDAIGRQVATDIPFYVAPDLLARGLTDFGAEAGFVRRGYGRASFDYGMPAAGGFVRHGVSDSLTIEGQAEASRRSAAAGIGAMWMPGLFGTFHANWTAARADGRDGQQWSAGYAYLARRWSLTLDHRRASRHYRTVADLDVKPGESRPGEDRRSTAGGTATRAFASFSLNEWGHVGLGYLDLRPASGPPARLATASWSLPLGPRASAFIGADYDPERRQAGVQLRISAALGGGSVEAGARRSARGRMEAQAQYSRAIPYAGGLGGTAGIAVDDKGAMRGQANMVARGAAVEGRAGLAFAGDRMVGLFGASGAVVAMDGGVHLANMVGGAFALVSTDGVAGVPVRYENQIIGVTNGRGHVFVPRVTAHHAALYAIDPLGLDADLSPSAVERRIAIPEGGGAVIRMPIRRTPSITLGLVDAAGTPLAPGSVADVDGVDHMVGWDGLLFLTDARDRFTFTVTLRDGGACQVGVTLPAGRAALDHLGAVPCV